MNFPAENRHAIGVLVVDDSAFMRTALSRMIASDPALFVVGTASSGVEALEKIPSLNPDVITLDVEMPGPNGLETLRRIMAQFPRPVIMVSSATVEDAEITLDALAAGAFDYVPKQMLSSSLDITHIRDDLVAKIKAAVESRRPREVLGRRPPQSSKIAESSFFFSTPPALVAVGTSTGGPSALQEILPQLPQDLPVPVLVVQHMPSGFTSSFAQRLNTLCSVRVQEAVHGKIVRPGVVYIAPAGVHLTLKRDNGEDVLAWLKAHPDSQHIPSIDIMMESVATTFGNLAMGIIMTGMGVDGVRGMTAIYRAGGMTIGQDESTCMVYSMPRACAEMGVLHKVVPLAQIPRQILQATNYRKRA